MPPNQDEVFFEREGNQWFKRNAQSLQNFVREQDLPLQLMELYRLRPKRALEIGAANGFRLNAITELFGAQATAVEPSLDAIRDGETRFPHIRFLRGTANKLPTNELYDLVIVSFVLHWVDRVHLFASFSEIDRILADGGYLIVADFAPANQFRVRYHHLPHEQVYTYKQDYAASFLATGLYQLIAMLTTEHGGTTLSAQVMEQNRIAGWLLRKAYQEQYIEHSFEPKTR
jgi:SAM-dependent methyltransferase